MAKPDGSSELPDWESARSFPVLASPVDIKSIDDVEKGLRNISPFVFECIRAKVQVFRAAAAPTWSPVCMLSDRLRVYSGLPEWFLQWHPLQ